MPKLDSLSPIFLSLLRFVTALVFLQHGTQKMLHFPPMPPPPPMAAAAAMAAHAVHHAPPWYISLAGPIELIGGALLLVGLLTRLTAFICSGEMAVAYFIGHAPRGAFPILNSGDEAILLCFVFLYLVFAGSGSVSLDALIFRKKRI